MNLSTRMLGVTLIVTLLLAALTACGVPAPAPTSAATAVPPTPITPPPTATHTPAPPTATPAPAVTPTPDLSGLPAGVWQLVRIVDMSGKVLTIEQPQNYTVQFLGDGRMSIKADCNGGSGTFKASEQGLTIGPLMTTKMACPSGSRDTEFLQGLQNAAAYLLDGEEFSISLAYDGGEMVFRRTR